MESQKPTKKQLQAADDYHKMKEYYYGRYMNQLRDKILEYDTQPPLHNTGKPPSLQRKLEPLNKQASNKKFKVQHQPLKISVPKSKRLTMLQAEEKLRKAGFLSNQDEVDEFRSGISSYDDLQDYVEKFIDSRTQSADQNSKPKSNRPLSKISEMRENSGKSRPATRAVKQTDADLNPYSGNKMMKPSEIAKAAAAALEKRCPRMDIPDLYCLRKEEDSDDETEMIKDRERSKQRDEYSKHVSYLRQMYQRAQANRAQAKRIIDNRDDNIITEDRESHLLANLSQIFADLNMKGKEPIESLRQHGTVREYNPEYDIPDITDTCSRVTELLPTESETPEDRLVRWRESTLTDARQQINIFTPIEEESATPISGAQSQALVVRDNQSQALVVRDNQSQALIATENQIKESNAVTQNRLAIEDGQQALQPLDMNDAREDVRIIESTALSTYWPNYLNVGKSKFARETQTQTTSPS